MTEEIYLDYAAATPVDSAVLSAMEPYFQQAYFNPSANYLAAKRVKQDLDTARAQVASVLGAKPSEIIFTAGGSEANNLAIKGVMQLYPDAELLVSSIEHDSVLAPAVHYDTKYISVDPQGIVQLSQLEHQISDKTVLISVMLANNEVGSLQPLRKITQLVQAVRRQRKVRGIQLPLYVHTDACQAGNYLDLHVARLGVDMMTLNGGKIYGPKQSGVLFLASSVQLAPQIEGGGQERNIRSGTENVAQAVGFALALEAAQASRHDTAYAMEELQTYFIAQLSEKIDGIVLNGSTKLRLPNNVHMTLPGQDNERLLYGLDEHGIMAAAGSACSASNDEPSHVLKAMGKSDAEAQASLRFTMGRSTTKQQLAFVAETLAHLAHPTLY